MSGSFGRNLKIAREALGWSQEALAQRAGLRGAATVCEAERGSDTKRSTMEALAAALGTTVSHLTRESTPAGGTGAGSQP